MAKISQATIAELNAFKDALSPKIQRARSLEEAAQQYVSGLYERFRDALVLARVFATVRYDRLPPFNQECVDKLAVQKHVRQLIHPSTLVLSLLGTRGVNAAWNDRCQSQGHVGIPLASAAFIDAIPMMSRLLKQLGVGLDWIDKGDTQIIAKLMGSMGGVFFVADAAAETDQQGRKIIAAQEFVTAYQVKTVFGFGGGYLGTETFVVTILFLRERLEQRQAGPFAAACTFFKAGTVKVVKEQKLFS